MNIETDNKEYYRNWLDDARRLIVFEGPDGVGKTYQANKIVQYFNDLGITAKFARLPHYFRDTMFSDRVTEEEKIGLSLLDCQMVIEHWLGDTQEDILVLDRFAHFSIEVYNLPNVKPEFRDMLGRIVRSDLVNNSIQPDIIFNLNRPSSFREPDNSYFEKRTNYGELSQRYAEISLVEGDSNYGRNLLYNSNAPYYAVYEGLLDTNATPNEVTEYLIELIKRST